MDNVYETNIDRDLILTTNFSRILILGILFPGTTLDKSLIFQPSRYTHTLKITFFLNITIEYLKTVINRAN